MENQTQFVKLIDIANSQDPTFVVEKVWGYKYKMWDAGGKKMVVEDRWFKGGMKKWGVKTDKGTLDLSQNQIGSMLEAHMSGGQSDINGKKFSVRTNSKTGIEVRYFINPVFEQVERYEEAPDVSGFDTEKIPF